MIPLIKWILPSQIKKTKRSFCDNLVPKPRDCLNVSAYSAPLLDFTIQPIINQFRIVIRAWEREQRVFDFLLQEKKIDQEVVRSMWGWPHSGFSIDDSVRITAADLLHSTLSLFPGEDDQGYGRRSGDYRAGKSHCLRFPEPGDERLKAGLSRNFQVFDALELVPKLQRLCEIAGGVICL